MQGSAVAQLNLYLRAVLQRLVEAERRGAAQEMRGKVTDVDTTKARARVEIGKDDEGKPVKSPWLPYKQIAGALKIHQPPSVGETMTVRSASGDIEQGVLESFHWSEENPANSTEEASNVLTFGDVKVTIDGGNVIVSIGGFTATFSGDGLDMQGGQIKHDGKNIGSTHRHGGVVQGGELTEPPAG